MLLLIFLSVGNLTAHYIRNMKKFKISLLSLIVLHTRGEDGDLLKKKYCICSRII